MAIQIVKPWQGSGIEVSGMTAQEALEASPINFKVAEHPLLTPVGAPDNFANLTKVSTHKAIVREDNGMILSIVGHKWAVLQNWEMFQFCDALVQAGLCKYHTAGSFKHGKIVWIQLEVAETEIVKGDVHKKYLILSNAFADIFSIKIGLTDTRVICWNTFMLATKEAAKQFTIRHTASMKDKVEDAKLALMANLDSSRHTDDFQRALARLTMTAAMWKDFGETLVPTPKEGANTTRADNNRQALLSLAVTGIGQDIPGVIGTGYAAFNALTQYVNYERTARGENQLAAQAGRYESTLYGSGAKMINQGMDVLNGYLISSGIQV